MPSAAHYGTAKHKAWAAKVLRRDGYLCSECARYGKRTPAKVAHHIKHLEDFPELAYVLSNGAALCESCHNKAHPEKGGRKK